MFLVGQLFSQVTAIKNSPQAVRLALSTVFTPSHVFVQLVSFPADGLLVFPVHMVQESSSLKYPALHT